jgi:hypothetical protein
MVGDKRAGIQDDQYLQGAFLPSRFATLLLLAGLGAG